MHALKQNVFQHPSAHIHESTSRYRILDRIAYGGIAEVFRGVGVGPDGNLAQYAIKRLLPEFAEDVEFVSMLREEFRLVSHLDHSNVTRVYDIAEVDDTVFLVMEYVEGKDLRSILNRLRLERKMFSIADSAYIIEQVLDGLNHAHQAWDDSGHFLELVHRDVSPSNILLGCDGAIKLCDFGIAKAKNSNITTRAGFVKGKIQYMSPEQARGRMLDARSDIFSAASVLYELLTGEVPFTAKNEIDLLYAVRLATVRPCQAINPRIPDRLASIVEKAMALSRSSRYQTAAEFRDALNAFRHAFTKEHTPNRLSRLVTTLYSEDHRDRAHSRIPRAVEESGVRRYDPGQEDDDAVDITFDEDDVQDAPATQKISMDPVAENDAFAAPSYRQRIAGWYRRASSHG